MSEYPAFDGDLVLAVSAVYDAVTEGREPPAPAMMAAREALEAGHDIISEAISGDGPGAFAARLRELDENELRLALLESVLDRMMGSDDPGS